jgi:hypothetical protein
LLVILITALVDGKNSESLQLWRMTAALKVYVSESSGAVALTKRIVPTQIGL